MIEVKELSFCYGKQEILHQVSASFACGEVTGILGPNGAGKSTLLRVMLGAAPQAGEVTVDSCPLFKLSPQERAKRIAYLSQSRAVHDMTVEQIVLHGRFAHLHYPRIYSQKDRELAAFAMEKMELLPLKKKPLSALSGGERQKAYVAMALCQESDYILLDEPTTHLDIAGNLALMRRLRTLAKDAKGVVAVLHDLPMALSFCDRLLVLHEGRAVFFGQPKTLFESGLIEEIFSVRLAFDTESGYRYVLDAQNTAREEKSV